MVTKQTLAVRWLNMCQSAVSKHNACYMNICILTFTCQNNHIIISLPLNEIDNNDIVVAVDYIVIVIEMSSIHLRGVEWVHCLFLFPRVLGEM